MPVACHRHSRAAALGNLGVAGAAQLDASVTTSATQTYGGNLTVGADATLSSSATSLGASLNIGGHSVTLFTNALGIAPEEYTTLFQGSVPLACGQPTPPPSPTPANQTRAHSNGRETQPDTRGSSPAMTE